MSHWHQYDLILASYARWILLPVVGTAGWPDFASFSAAIIGGGGSGWGYNGQPFEMRSLFTVEKIQTPVRIEHRTSRSAGKPLIHWNTCRQYAVIKAAISSIHLFFSASIISVLLATFISGLSYYYLCTFISALSYIIINPLGYYVPY